MAGWEPFKMVMLTQATPTGTLLYMFTDLRAFVTETCGSVTGRLMFIPLRGPSKGTGL